jgi:hypothetical protein
VFGQRFDAAGNRLGAEFLVNTFTTNRQGHPAVAREPDGHFVVTWTSTDQLNATGADEVFGQRLSAAGARVGTEFRANTYTPLLQFESAVAALGPGSFVVVWTSQDQDGSYDGIYAQRFGDLIFADGFEGGS